MALGDELGLENGSRRGEAGMRSFRAGRLWSKRTVKHRWLWTLVAMLAIELVHGQDLGTWEIVVENAGIASMHAAVTHYGTVVLLDRTNTGATQIALPSTSRTHSLCRKMVLLELSLTHVSESCTVLSWSSRNQVVDYKWIDAAPVPNQSFELN